MLPAKFSTGQLPPVPMNPWHFFLNNSHHLEYCSSWNFSWDKFSWTFILENYPWIVFLWGTTLHTIASHETPSRTTAFLNLALRQLPLDNPPSNFANMKLFKDIFLEDFPPELITPENPPINFIQENWSFHGSFCGFLCFGKYFTFEIFRKMQ